MITLNLSQIFMVFLVVFTIFMLLGTIFWLGVNVGRMIENKSRGILGVRRGSSAILADGGQDDEDPLAKFVGKQFMGDGWTEETVGPKAKIGHHDPDAAAREVDRHVQRFIDSTVFGRGPQRGRTGDEEDDL